MTTAFWDQPVRVFQHLLRESDLLTTTPADIIEEVLAVRADAYIAMGGGFSAWYPSKLESQRVNPYMSGDFLGEVIASARPHGIKVIARMDVSKGRPEWLAGHPDWFVRLPGGAPNLVWEMPQTCYTGPFWQEEVFRIVAEILDRYEVDGFFFNYLNIARCWCDRCQEKVRRDTGMAVPPPEVRTPEYERWRQRELAAYMGRIKTLIQSKSPDAVLIPYHHVRDGWDYNAMAEAADIGSAQASNPIAVNPVDPQPQWNHWGAEEVLAARSVGTGRPAIMIQTGSEFFASRQTAMPAHRLVRNLIQVAAHGGSPAPSFNAPLRRQDDPRAVETLLDFNRYLAANREWYRGLRSIAKVAVVRSQDSIEWGPDGGNPAGDPRRPGHVAEFRGAYEAISRLRYPCDVLTAGRLTAEKLSRYRAIVLPAVSCITDLDAQAVDAYVEAGGCVIATADTGANDSDGRRRLAPALKCLPWTPGESRVVFGAYFELVSAELQQELGGVPHIGAMGDLWVPGSGSGSDKPNGDLRLIGPFRNNAPEFTVVRRPGSEPGLITHPRGNGKAVWLPWRVGAMFHLQGIPEYASLFGALLRGSLGLPPVHTEAPGAVEAVLYAHQRGMILHLINGAAPQNKPIAELTPLAGFAVSIRCPATKAIQLHTGSEIPVQRNGPDAIIQIDRLDSFAAVALL